MEQCKCCEKKSTPPKSRVSGRGYNRVHGMNARWARKNGETKSEFTVSVKGGKRFGGSQTQKDHCGDGTFGFPTRRKGHDEAKMERGLDGQWKKRRHTLVNSRSARSVQSRHARQLWGNRCGIATNNQVLDSERDPIIVMAKKQLAKINNLPRRRMNRRERVERASMLSELRSAASGLGGI